MLPRESAASKMPKCSSCDAPALWEVWKLPLCVDCHTVWIRDERFSSKSVNDALGIGNRPEDFSEANHQRYCVEAEKRTRQWLNERAKARAA